MALQTSIEDFGSIASDPVWRELISRPLSREFPNIGIVSEYPCQIEPFQSFLIARQPSKTMVSIETRRRQ